MDSNLIPWSHWQGLLERDGVVPDCLVFEKISSIECRCGCQNNILLEAESGRHNDWALDSIAGKRVVDLVSELK